MGYSRVLKYIPWVIVLSFFGISVFLYAYSSPEFLITWVGVENAYLLLFFLAFLSGLSSFGGVPYHLVLIALATGGLNPWLLGLGAAGGAMLGDSTSYFIGYQGRAVISQRLERLVQKFSSFFARHSKFLPLFFFLYGSLVPFSNDFIGISMGLARYPFWRVMIPLGLGNVVFNISLAFMATYAYEVLNSIFS